MTKIIKNLKNIAISTILLSLSGCITAIATANCLDSKIKRDPVERKFIYSIENINTGKIDTRTITCSGTYSAQCSTRGNSWQWIQKKIEPFKISLGNDEDIYINFPTCRDFEHGKIKKKRTSFKIKDGRTLTLNRVWVKVEKLSWAERLRWPIGYGLMKTEDSDYTYYMNEKYVYNRDNIRHSPNKDSSDEVKEAYYSMLNKEKLERKSYVIPLNFSYK